MNRILTALEVGDEADTTGEVIELPGMVRVVAVMRSRRPLGVTERLLVVYERNVDDLRPHRIRIHIVGNGDHPIPSGAVLLNFAAESGLASYIEHLPDLPPPVPDGSPPTHMSALWRNR